MVSVHYIHCWHRMDFEVKQSKGTQPPRTHSEHGKRDRETKRKEEKQLCHIWWLWHPISSQEAWKCHEQASFVPNTEKEPRFSAAGRIQLSWWGNNQEEPSDQMGFARCKLTLVPPRNTVSLGAPKGLETRTPHVQATPTLTPKKDLR